MNRNQENGFHGTHVTEPQAAVSGPPPTENANAPYVPQKEKPQSSLKDNGRIMAIGAGLVLVLLVLAFRGISHQYLTANKPSVTNTKPSQSQPPNA